MNRLYAFLIIAKLLLSTITGSSQFLRFDHISSKEGLSQGNINCIFQDSRGFLWIGTRDGLNRYDGYKFVIYRNQIHDTTSITDDFVVDVAEDSAGDLWIATRNGLDRLNRKTFTFTRFFHAATNENSISDNALNKLAFDKTGYLWIATMRGGLDRVDIHAQTYKHFKNDPGNGRTISDNSVRTVFCDSRGIIWAGTFNGGLNRIDPATQTVQRIALGGRPGDKTAKNIPCLFEDGHHLLWVGTQDDGLFSYNEEKKLVTRFVHSETDHNTISSNTVFSLNEDLAGNLWIGTENGGLCVLDGKTGHIERYLHDEIDNSSIGGNSIYAICQDRQHNFWLGAFSAGINLYKSSTENFIHYRHTSQPSSLSNNLIWDITLDSKKNVWISTDGGGVNMMPAGTDSFVHYRAGRGGLSGDFVIVSREMANKEIWIGTWGNGISILNPQTRKFRYLFHSDSDSNSISSNNILALLQGSNHDIWIGTANQGLDRYDEVTHLMKHYRYDERDTTSISSNLISSLLEDSKGRLWVGTFDNGLDLLDKRSGKFTRFVYHRTGGGVSNNTIPDLFEDSKGNIWISTFHGLTRRDGRTGRFTVYTSEDGLPGNIIYATREDAHGSLWISTNTGLSVLNPATGQFKNYTSEDGLQGDEFKLHSASMNSEGNLYFGGINGFNLVNPDKLKKPGGFSGVLLTSFLIFNKPVAIASEKNKRTPLVSDISETRSIVLSHDQTDISFEFAALDFSAPSRKRYAYRLEHYDKEWIYVGSRNSAYYTNLPPGDYQFKIKYQNSLGEWSPIYTKLDIRIIPPFWQTWWFRLFAAIVIIGIVYIYNRVRMRSIRSQQVRLENQVKAKTREILKQKDSLESLLIEKEWLLKEVHHRVKNDLAIIMSLLNTQSSYVKNDAAFTAIGESKHRIYSISLLHEKLYRSDNFSYVSMDTYINELITYLSDSFNINGLVNVQSCVEPLLMDMAQALPVGLILNEAVTNSFKYAFSNTSGGSIFVVLSKHADGNVNLTIGDDGVGFLDNQYRQPNTSMGLSLIQGLADQLEARLVITNEKGVSISVEFPYVAPVISPADLL